MGAVAGRSEVQHSVGKACLVSVPTSGILRAGAGVDRSNSISGLVVEYIVAIDVTRVRFPADALFEFPPNSSFCLVRAKLFFWASPATLANRPIGDILISSSPAN